MSVWPGGPALSAFRIARLLPQARARAPEVASLACRHRFVADVSAPLSARTQAQIGQLLGDDSPPDSLSVTVPHRLIMPRPGTVSPWSSKATDILHRLDLRDVRRIERATAWWAFDGSGAPVSRLDRLDDLLADAMTERAASGDEPMDLLFRPMAPAPLVRIPVQAKGRDALAAANQALALALSDGEIDYLVDAFRTLRRDPSDAELMMVAQANSEHCRHKVFNASWTVDGEAADGSLFEHVRRTHRAAPGRVLVAYEDNAAIAAGPSARRLMVGPDRVYVEVDEPTHVLMKVETHNHPTAISPNPGAGTGNGGEIRDEGATGRGGKPRAGLIGLMTSDLHLPDLPAPWEMPPSSPGHIATPLAILLEAPIGGAAYNNEFGRPTLAGFYRAYEAVLPDGSRRGYHKPILLAGGIGHVRDGHVHKRDIPPGSALIVLGGPAMRIGIGGGAASSMAGGSADTSLDFASVQRANAELERRCQEVIDAAIAMGDANPILSIHAVGAGGLSNALPELVHGSGRGASLRLDALPSADPSLSPLEIWVNEAQERYVLAVSPDQLPVLEAICHRERCPYAVVGHATEAPHLLVDAAPEAPVDLPLHVILGRPPKMERDTRRPGPAVIPSEASFRLDFTEATHRVLRHPTVASKTYLITIGDRTVGGLTARDMFVGPWQVPVADCAVVAADFHGRHGEAMALGERPPVALIDPAASARLALAEALTNLAGADVRAWDQVVLSANWMAALDLPGEDARLREAVVALGEACKALGICIPVGKDSLSMAMRWRGPTGEANAVRSPVSLVVSAFAPVVDVRRTRTPLLSAEDAELWLLDLGADRTGGSILAQVDRSWSGRAPDCEDMSLLQAALTQLVDAPMLAWHDRSDGGLWVTLLEMAFASRCGLDIDLPGNSPLASAFSEEVGGVLQIARSDVDQVVAAFAAAGVPLKRLGRSLPGRQVVVRHRGQVLFDGDRQDLHRRWEAVSANVAGLRDDPTCVAMAYDTLLDEGDPGTAVAWSPRAAPIVRDRRPRVAILREVGVNGQLEMAAAFLKAGFTAVDVTMTDLLDGRATLDDVVGLAACGGFSYGDVLGAGGGWAASILHHRVLRDAFATFFARSETFALGVCNGCQMMAQLGPLIPGAEGWPRFRRNRSEQFEARLVSLELAPSPSIFLGPLAGSILPIASAHGEGRAMFADGRSDFGERVAARYVDGRGRPTEHYPSNPNGSAGGIAAVTTLDGRVTLMMPHPERVIRTAALSWAPADWPDDSPWQHMFHAARSWVG